MSTSPRTPAPQLSVARVLPLLGLAHLDRLFDYRISTEQDEEAQVGVRVRVRFAGRLVDALLIERVDTPEHEGELKYLERVISPAQVYPPQLQKLVNALAKRYAGVRSDIIRSAIPSRHARAENTPADEAHSWEDLGEVQEPDLSPWAAYTHGQSFVDAVLAGSPARAAWQIAPGEDWAKAIAALATKVVLDGAGALVVVPDQRDVEQLEQAFRQHVAAKQLTILHAGLGPQARYRRYLNIVHGQGRLVVGTRSAAFAPVKNLQLCVLLHDGDENLVDPRAPYPHAREVLTTRCAQEQCALILGGYHRTAETQLLVESGWVHDLLAPREVIRARSPWIRAVADSDFELERDPRARSARLPLIAFEALRAGLEKERPVLIQVPRKGYVPTLACGVCRSPARCRHCNGPMGLPSSAQQHPQEAHLPTCRWCGRPDTQYRCHACGSFKLRAVVLGAERTAEEIGRAFPQVPVHMSGGNRIIDYLEDGPQIVVATPGAEPLIKEGGLYGAAIMVDTWAMLGRQDLRATEDTLGKWAAAASRVRHDGEVIVVADSSLAVVQALITWDMRGAAARELAQRGEVQLPPTVHMAAIDGATAALDTLLEVLELPKDAEILGPVDLPPGTSLPGEYEEERYGPPQRLLIRAPLGPRNELGEALRQAQVARFGRRGRTQGAGGDLPLRIQVDPLRVG